MTLRDCSVASLRTGVSWLVLLLLLVVVVVVVVAVVVGCCCSSRTSLSQGIL